MNTMTYRAHQVLEENKDKIPDWIGSFYLRPDKRLAVKTKAGVELVLVVYGSKSERNNTLESRLYGSLVCGENLDVDKLFKRVIGSFYQQLNSTTAVERAVETLSYHLELLPIEIRKASIEQLEEIISEQGT